MKMRIPLPVFMPDATCGTVKGLTTRQLRGCGVEMIVVNTIHLMLRLGQEDLEEMGGIKSLTGWGDLFVILSDSGGFQASTFREKKITEEGFSFRSPVDGTWHLLTPEKSIEVQFAIGSDVMVALDYCTKNAESEKETEYAVELTTRWAKRSKQRFDELCEENKSRGEKKLIGVLQGGRYKSLREKSVKGITEVGFDGYGLGGWSVVPETGKLDYDITGFVADLLVDEPIRYAMGIGNLKDIVTLKQQGWNMFDTVLPTRDGRHGRLYLTPDEYINVKNSRFSQELAPPDQDCQCYTCQNYNLAYLHHLIKSKELLGQTLCSIHNVHAFCKTAKG